MTAGFFIRGFEDVREIAGTACTLLRMGEAASREGVEQPYDIYNLKIVQPMLQRIAASLCTVIVKVQR